MDFTAIVVRLTVLSSVPAAMSEIMKRQYLSPMVLDGELQAVGVQMHQWDFEDPGTDNPGTGAHMICGDHGIVGGYPLTSTVDLRPLYQIVEKA